MSIKTYSELIKLSTFEERFDYLKLQGKVGQDTFGFDRIFNQKFYTSTEWRRVRNQVITRDLGCDLGIEEYEIPNGTPIYIHHMNPITLKDLNDRTEYLLNPEFLITTTYDTHNAIHYGTDSIFPRRGVVIERRPNDTCPWKR